jgi:hypothetical protein
MRTFIAGTFTFLLSALTVQAESVINLPGLEIRGAEKKRVEATGNVSLTNGILEFIAVEKGGRDYESLFTLDSKPSALKFALLLIGCETNDVPGDVKAAARAGDRLRIEVEWQVGGKPKRVPVEKLLVNRKTKKSPTELAWVFTGSRFVKDIEGRDVFLADAEQAFISLWWNPAVLINVAGEFGNPYHGDDQGFEVNAGAAPPKDTPIRLIFRKVSE